MKVYNIYEGNRRTNEALLADVEDADVETIPVTETQRRRSRFRTETTAGREVGVVVAHELRTGDILAAADESAPLLEVDIEAIPAMALEAAAFASAGAAASFGHAVGNRHWDLATLDGRILVHADASKDRMVDALAAHLPDSEIAWETVPPDLFDRDDVGHAHAAHGEHG